METTTFSVQICNVRTGAFWVWEEMTEELLAEWMAELSEDFEVIEKF